MLAEGVELVRDLHLWIQIPLILLGSLIVAKLVEVVGRILLQRVQWISAHDYDVMIAEELRLPLVVSIILGGIYLSASLIPDLTHMDLVAAGVLSIIILLWARAAIRLGNKFILITNRSPTEREIAPIFKVILTFFVIVASFFALLATWQLDITPFLASAGILGIIIGIAAQDSLGNFFGGLSLHFDKTYQLGDVIELESGERGTVIDMSIRSTTILTRDNIAVTVPNRQMNATQIINESAPVRRRRIRLNVGVAYGSDLELVESAILQAADEEDIVLDSPAPIVRFRRFGDSSIVAQLQCFIEHPAQRGRSHHLLIRRIDQIFDENDIKIPFPQRELTFFESGNEITLEAASREEGLEGEADVTISDGFGSNDDTTSHRSN